VKQLQCKPFLDFLATFSLSAYKVKTKSSLFERPLKMKKNGVISRSRLMLTRVELDEL